MMVDADFFAIYLSDFFKILRIYTWHFWFSLSQTAVVSWLETFIVKFFDMIFIGRT